MQPAANQPLSSRRVQIEGTYNLRHVGGYGTKDGRFTRPYTLFRSDNLHTLTPAGQQTLLDYGIRTIIDLRRLKELKETPNIFANSDAVNYQHMPLYDRWRILMGDLEYIDGQAHQYQLILDNCHDSIRAVLATAIEPNALPMLVHCQAGKDRTGVIIALFLAIAEVHVETIVADYALSDGYLRPLLNHIRADWKRQGRDMAYYEQFLQSPPETMQQTFQYLTERYGSVRQYLHTVGLTEAQLLQIQARLVE